MEKPKTAKSKRKGKPSNSPESEKLLLSPPTATYRLQFNSHFTFAQAEQLVDYWSELGVGACYASPLLRAREGSLHCYDVTDPTQLNPEIGSEEQLEALAQRLKGQAIGLIMDLVPNHMCIADPRNRWWSDVLENGRYSPCADYFDIDWEPQREQLRNRVLLPFLDKQYGEALEQQELQLRYHEGTFMLAFAGKLWPLRPRSWMKILKPLYASARTKQDEEDPHSFLELQSIITALENLPELNDRPSNELLEAMRSEKEVIRQRIAALLNGSPWLAKALEKILLELNGRQGDPSSFDALEELLDQQLYRFCFRRVANAELNYRRFFDVNELAGLRIQNKSLFEEFHSYTMRLIGKGWISGLRLDHIDGLSDPHSYLNDLQALIQKTTGETGQKFLLLIEKILSAGELLPAEWPVAGTTGYEVLNQINQLQLVKDSREPFEQLYREFTGQRQEVEALIYLCKKLILTVSLSSEVNMLARELDRVAEQHRESRDFTLDSLKMALTELLACFPVYRTYIQPGEGKISEQDQLWIRTALEAAGERNPSTSSLLFAFIERVLLLQNPPKLSAQQLQQRHDFVLRFQQLTSVVTAKGVEDTFFYRYFPLASLNEVGSDPNRFSCSRLEFHSWQRHRAEQWPLNLIATSTHDNKRSEDVRSRLNVLSEIEEKWRAAIGRWREINRSKKSGKKQAPDANDEYLLYQTLVGTWPLYPMDASTHAHYIERIDLYMQKAVREAKVHTSWVNPNERYEKALSHFIHSILCLEPDNSFLQDFNQFIAPLILPGLCNSLVQVALKVALPGIADFYQGSELWNFRLVDPDNRIPVDYAHRRSLLGSLLMQSEQDPLALAHYLMEHPEDGLIKLYTTAMGLRARRSHPELFLQGKYRPLKVEGDREESTLAFARTWRKEAAILLVGRFFTRLALPLDLSKGRVWGSSQLHLGSSLPAGCYRDIFTGREWKLSKESSMQLPIGELLSPLPFALLIQA